jgi:hypothetical protein
MTEDQASLLPRPTQGDVLLFFRTHHPDLKCPVCGAEEFEIQYEDESGLLVLPSAAAFGRDGPVAPVIAVCCLKCAHLLFFSFTVIKEKIAQIRQMGSHGRGV